MRSAQALVVAELGYSAVLEIIRDRQFEEDIAASTDPLSRDREKRPAHVDVARLVAVKTEAARFLSGRDAGTTVVGVLVPAIQRELHVGIAKHGIVEFKPELPVVQPEPQSMPVISRHDERLWPGGKGAISYVRTALEVARHANGVIEWAHAAGPQDGNFDEVEWTTRLLLTPASSSSSSRSRGGFALDGIVQQQRPPDERTDRRAPRRVPRGLA